MVATDKLPPRIQFRTGSHLYDTGCFFRTYRGSDRLYPYGQRCTLFTYRSAYDPCWSFADRESEVPQLCRVLYLEKRLVSKKLPQTYHIKNLYQFLPAWDAERDHPLRAGLLFCDLCCQHGKPTMGCTGHGNIRTCYDPCPFLPGYGHQVPPARISA